MRGLYAVVAERGAGMMNKLGGNKVGKQRAERLAA